MKIELINPLALLLLLLIPASLYAARHSLATLSRGRRRASVAARVIVVLLVVLALAGLRIRTTTRDLALFFLVDVSASVASAEQERVIAYINSEIERAAPSDYVGVIAFGREASVELAPTRKEALGDYRLSEISSNPPKDYTDIASALRLAAALVPESAVGRLVLISDGNENLESAAGEAPLLQAQGIEVHTLSLQTASGEMNKGEVSVRDLSAPQMLAESEAFDLQVTVDSTRDTEATLRLFRNDSLVAERQVRLAASGENVFVVPQRNEQKGFYSYRAEIEAVEADSFAQNNSREAFTLVEGRPKTLYVYGDPQPSAAISRVLSEGSFAADLRPAAGVPTTLAGFQDYDLVIFDNVPATVLTTGQMKMVQAYVRDLGGGFVMIGGDKSFGPGGYYKTPVEETLPVSLDVRQKKHFPSLAIVLVIDRSGSMSGEKIELALEAAYATVDYLSDRDSLGVVAFDSSASPAVALTHVEDKAAIRRQVRGIQVGGGTNMYPGLQMAYEWLLASDAQLKHVIVLSDGQSEGGDFAGIARAMRNADITLSTVAVGEDADGAMMEMLAAGGGGRFYEATSPESLPRIFTREAFLASRDTIIEEPFVPRLVRPTQGTGGIDWSAAPPLGGYVGTAERDSLKSPAITSLISHKDDPIYAVWQYGLGRASAFTSDAKGRWATGWMNWPGFGQFWTQALRDTLRREGANDLDPRVEIDAGRGRVTVEAVAPDGSFKNNLRLRAHVIAPDLSATDLPLDQTAAGRYEGSFPAVMRGAYLVSVSEEGGQAAPTTGSVNSYSPEFAITGEDKDLLSRLSEATGGRVVPGLSGGLRAGDDAEAAAGAGLFERKATRTEPREIWEALLLAALLLLPVDVGIRRLNITREQVDGAREWVAAQLRRPSSEGAEAEAMPEMAQLKAARARVRLGAPGSAPAEPVVNLPADKPRGVAASAPPAVPAGESRPLASRLLDARKKKQT
ncbi:MAG TPA: VWA domain-containing protein [Blastocatellia bacterium]|jgi:Mg-chelatase subunit ChlD|nr:VWA domain-containing protein [Blastocatellia bacterium]